MSSQFTVVTDAAPTRWRFIGLDSSTDPTSTGTLPDDQLEYLEAKLTAADEPAFVLLHHPAGEENTLFGLPPAISGVNEEGGASAFREVLARHRDTVAGVYQGHTHRNNRTLSPQTTGPLPFYEGASTKEYPAGYSILKLYEGGYTVNFPQVRRPGGAGVVAAVTGGVLRRLSLLRVRIARRPQLPLRRRRPTTGRGGGIRRSLPARLTRRRARRQIRQGDGRRRPRRGQRGRHLPPSASRRSWSSGC